MDYGAILNSSMGVSDVEEEPLPTTSAVFSTISPSPPMADEGLGEFYAATSGEDRLFLELRYYARHFIPIFCVVGIVGNCMALLLIRYGTDIVSH